MSVEHSNSNTSTAKNKASVPVPTPDTSVFFLITARCNGKKMGEKCDHKMGVDCFTPETCYAANITKAEVHHCECQGVGK